MAEILVEVHPIHDDALERGYRTCDFCYESAVEDIWADRPWRKFYHTTDGSGLDVCEHCAVQEFPECISEPASV